MKILVLHSEYNSGPVSGENRVVADEVALLRSGGHHVESWTPTPTGRGVRLATGAVWSRAAADEVRRRAREFRPDVVHVHNLFPALSPAVLRTIDSTAAVVMTLHNYRFMCLPGTLLRNGVVCEDCVGATSPWRGVGRGCYRGSVSASAALWSAFALHTAAGTFGRVDRYLAVSRFLRDKYVDAGFQPSSILVKPNFTWPVKRRSGQGAYFLYIGRLSTEKGVDVLLDAWRADDAPRARLVIVGDGPARSELQLRSAEGVEFWGAHPPTRRWTLSGTRWRSSYRLVGTRAHPEDHHRGVRGGRTRDRAQPWRYARARIR